MWKVNYDHTESKSILVTSRSWNESEWELLSEGQKTEIQLYDDDHNLYYSGVTSDIDEDEDRAFAPLDWAMHYAGCTYMKYKDPKTGEWKVL